MKGVGQHLESQRCGVVLRREVVVVSVRREKKKKFQTRASMRTMVEICWSKMRRSSL